MNPHCINYNSFQDAGRCSYGAGTNECIHIGIRTNESSWFYLTLMKLWILSSTCIKIQMIKRIYSLHLMRWRILIANLTHMSILLYMRVHQLFLSLGACIQSCYMDSARNNRLFLSHKYRSYNVYKG